MTLLEVREYADLTPTVTALSGKDTHHIGNNQNIGMKRTDSEHRAGCPLADSLGEGRTQVHRGRFALLGGTVGQSVDERDQRRGVLAIAGRKDVNVSLFLSHATACTVAKDIADALCRIFGRLVRHSLVAAGDGLIGAERIVAKKDVRVLRKRPQLRA